MHRGDHRHRDADPVVGDSLKQVRRLALDLVGEPASATAGRHDADHVQARAEARPVAVQHDRAHARLRRDPFGGAGDLLEHRQIQRVVLLGPRQRDDRDVVVDPDVDPVVRSSATGRDAGRSDRDRVADPHRPALQHLAVDPERERLGAVDLAPVAASSSSVGRSTSAVSGSRLVIRQRPMWPCIASDAGPTCTRRPTHVSSSWARRRRSRSASGSAGRRSSSHSACSASRRSDPRETTDAVAWIPRSTAVRVATRRSGRSKNAEIASAHGPITSGADSRRPKNWVCTGSPSATRPPTAAPSGNVSVSSSASGS